MSTSLPRYTEVPNPPLIIFPFPLQWWPISLSRAAIWREKHNFIFSAQIKLYFRFPCKDCFGVYCVIRVNFVQWIDEKSVNLFFPPKLNYISVSFAVMANLGLVCIAELMPASNKLSNMVKLTYSRPPKLFDVTDLNWWKTLYVSLHWQAKSATFSD